MSNHSQQTQDFAFLRVSPELFAVGWGGFEVLPASESRRSAGFIVCEFDPAAEPKFLRPAQFDLLSAASLEERLEGLPTASLEELQWEKFSQQNYGITFSSLQELLGGGKLQKAVPTIVDRAECRNPEGLLSHFSSILTQSDPRLFQYALWFRGEGMFGVSPEILFRLDPRQQLVSTVALAASRPPEKEHELLEDFKEIREQRLVRDFLVEQLEAYGSVRDFRPEILTLKNVSHIRQRIECICREEVSWPELIDLLHPTPALGAYPRSAMDEALVQRLDPSGDRRRHGAPFGVVLPDGDVLSIVAIRNVQLIDNEARIAAGGGLLRESTLDSEWNELQMKIRSVRSNFQI